MEIWKCKNFIEGTEKMIVLNTMSIQTFNLKYKISYTNR